MCTEKTSSVLPVVAVNDSQNNMWIVGVNCAFMGILKESQGDNWLKLICVALKHQ